MKTLILGGMRSGKSRLASRYAIDSELPVTYLATATAGDDEMATRIQAHKQSRQVDWTVIEEPVYLSDAIRGWQADHEGECLIVDCLTLWLTNLFGQPDQNVVLKEQRSLLEMLPSIKGEIILVSNEINMGVVPMGQLSRRFCDAAGTLHQNIAQEFDRVVLTVAGIPTIIKNHSDSI